MSIAKAANAVGSIGGVAAAAKKLASLFNGGGDYWSQLRPASYNGVPFAVLSETGSFGRRSVIHEYPNKETKPWVEDLGMQTNVLRITGFLVENSLVYGGGPVFEQRSRLLNAIRGGALGSTKAPGLGELVHPTWGRLKTNCMEAEFGTSWDHGRVVEVRLVFVQGGDRLYPQAKKPSSDAVLSAASALSAPSLASLVKSIASAVVAGAAAIQAAVSTVVGWYQAVNGLVHDVKRFWNSISTLSGNFGRLFGGGNTGYVATKRTASAATVSSLIAGDTAKREAVATTGAALTVAAGNIIAAPAAFATAAQAVTSALAASAASPADAIRLLSSLLAYSPTPVVGASQAANAQAVMQAACAAMLRRAVIGQIAVSATSYQPSSADDAAAMRDTIIGLMDAEITIAADQGEDDVYLALRALRTAVVDDFGSRGAGLSEIRSYSFGDALPALVLANRLYRDPSRSDELVTQAAPIHPAFMPTTFKALSR